MVIFETGLTLLAREGGSIVSNSASQHSASIRPDLLISIDNDLRTRQTRTSGRMEMPHKLRS